MDKPTDLELAGIWEALTMGAHHVGDAIVARRRNPEAVVRGDVYQALQFAKDATERMEKIITFVPYK